MHKHMWNALKLEFELTPRSPLLIKSGTLSPNPSLPDMQFVRTITSQGENIFIPGSSLKGVFRGYTEKILRTIQDSGGKAWSCNPLLKGEKCEDIKIKGLNEKKNGKKADYTPTIYRESCNACKLYGNTRLRGRLSFTDLFPKDNFKTETRYGVAISRLTNAVSAGPFDMEVLVEGVFSGSLVLENFEIWQLGLLALTIQAINEGFVKVGFGKNRGLGEVYLKINRALLQLAKKNEIGVDEIWGVGNFVSEEERGLYGLQENDVLRNTPQVIETDMGIFVRREFDIDEWKQIEELALDHLKVLENNP